VSNSKLIYKISNQTTEDKIAFIEEAISNKKMVVFHYKSIKNTGTSMEQRGKITKWVKQGHSFMFDMKHPKQVNGTRVISNVEDDIKYFSENLLRGPPEVVANKIEEEKQVIVPFNDTKQKEEEPLRSEQQTKEEEPLTPNKKPEQKDKDETKERSLIWKIFCNLILLMFILCGYIASIIFAKLVFEDEKIENAFIFLCIIILNYLFIHCF
jgi:hypothetical protein